MRHRRFFQTREGPVHLSTDGAHLIRNGVTTPENADLVSLFLRSWIGLLSDSPLVHKSGFKPRSVIRRFYFQVTTTTVSETIAHYASLADMVMISPTIFGEGSSTGPFIPDFKDTPIFREYHLWYRTGDPELLRFILTFLRFGKKLEYQDEQLAAVAFRDWLEVEQELGELRLPEMTDDLARIVDALLYRRYSSDGTQPEPSPYMEKHGSGRVADGTRSKIRKANSVKYHPRLDRAFFQQFVYAGEAAHHPRSILPDPDLWATGRVALKLRSSDTSRLMFVPKTTKTARSICMEPTSFMYFQQHVLWRLVRDLEVSWLGRYVTINDQTRNQELSLYGSYSGNVDTIDLSAASDRVSLALVKRVFPRRYLYYLLATRTTKVLTPNGTTVVPRKFAPMGSALCFPVQSILFASIIVMAHMLLVCEAEDVPLSHFSGTPSRIHFFMRSYLDDRPGVLERNPVSGKFEPFSAYGDDLICDFRVTTLVESLLHQFGLKVNTEKSFRSNQAFRESCGKFYWNGYDVTPHQFKCKHFAKHLNARSVASAITLVNNLGDGGYAHAKRAVLQELLWGDLEGITRKQREPNPIKFSEDQEEQGTIYSTNPRNNHLKRRIWDSSQLPSLEEEAKGAKVRTCDKYQIEEVKAIQIIARDMKSPRPRQRDAYERQLLIEWWRAAVGRSSSVELSEAPSARTEPQGLRLCRGWLPA